MRARELVYHVACFTCASCGTPLNKGDQFGQRDGLVYCRWEARERLIITILQRPPLLVINEFDDEIDSSARCALSHQVNNPRLQLPLLLSPIPRDSNDSCRVLMTVIGTNVLSLGFREDDCDSEIRGREHLRMRRFKEVDYSITLKL